jgi:gamma-glutamyltranspeptidase/glutathione hydrolase
MSLVSRRLAALAAFAVLSACATPIMSRHDAPAPRVFDKGMVSAADPRAAEAGAAMLRKGGSATDAAIAAMAVLGLVEPQSAGIGGGAFLLHFDGESERIVAYDGREEAPRNARPDMFIGADGKTMNFRDAVTSGLSVGTPSLIAMLEMAHRTHGALTWAELFDPAIKLAEDGFVVSPRLAQFIALAARGNVLQANPTTRAYFFDANGQPLQAGVVLKNPEYAASLRAIQQRGARALQEGPIADAIIATVRAEPRPGAMTLEDLQRYKPRKMEPVCGAYRVYRVCGMGPPSSGGVAVLSILGLYERARPSPVGVNDADDWSAFLWASRIGYADRDHYLADDRFVPVPTQALIDPRYLDARAKEITPAKAPAGLLQPGDPSTVIGGPSLLDRWGRDKTNEVAGTTHLSVVDAQGNAVALTATVESIFGSQRMAGGFFLNNELTDFSLEPTKNGLPQANAVAPGKRPRSSMAPTIITDKDGALIMTIGSPGGSAIISYVARNVIATLDWNMTLTDALNLGHITARLPQARSEQNRVPPAIAEGLSARGWNLQPTTLEASGVHAIMVTPNGLVGAADPRREGAVRSE